MEPSQQQQFEERRVAQWACNAVERRLRAHLYEAPMWDQETEIPREAVSGAAPPPSSFAP